MVLGILWLYWVGSVLAVIFAAVALNQFKSSGKQGRGIAIAGLTLGLVGVGTLFLVIIIVAAAQTHSSSGAGGIGSPVGSESPTTTIGSTTPLSHYASVSPVGGTQDTWTIDAAASGGYSEQMQVLVGHPEHASSSAVNGNSAPDSCYFNSQTDAIVPVVITWTNTSSSRTQSGGLQLDWSPIDTVQFDMTYSSGDMCEQSGSFGFHEHLPVATGTEVVLDGFIVISNYYSGTLASRELGSVHLAVQSNQDFVDDNGTDYNYQVSSVAGPGVADSGGTYEFTLVGQ
jgi:hypothetical protein